jgi:GNAT superfamily N-acetyltransferase
MALAIAENQKAYLTPELVRESLRVMGLDTTLVEDGTYFVVSIDRQIAGCGGWSRRRTLYGGDHSAGRDADLLDPGTESARVRAMYTHPDFVRRGVGRLILQNCEAAAKAEGFARVELMATLSGEPLYLSYGFNEIERISDGGVPLIRMGKTID